MNVEYPGIIAGVALYHVLFGNQSLEFSEFVKGDEGG